MLRANYILKEKLDPLQGLANNNSLQVLYMGGEVETQSLTLGSL